MFPCREGCWRVGQVGRDAKHLGGGGACRHVLGTEYNYAPNPAPSPQHPPAPTHTCCPPPAPHTAPPPPQGVPIAKRFALVPLGPPLMAYSSTSKSMITYDSDSRCEEGWGPEGWRGIGGGGRGGAGWG